MKIDGPGGEDATVVKGLFGNDVLLAEDDISEELYCFAGPANVCHPRKTGVFMGEHVWVGPFVSPFVLECIPSAESG